MSAVSAPGTRPIALALLRRSEHLLFAVLLIVGAANAWATPGAHRWLVLAGALLVACWYVVGMVVARHSRVRWHAFGWLLVLTAGCATLVAGSSGFVWVAFPLFLLYAQLLPAGVAIPSIAVLTAGTIAAIGIDRGQLTPAVVVGPVISATVAVVITIVYRDLAEQVRQRALLIDQLTATRDELAASQRQAGMLAERERLAREIHDTITQSLTSIVLVLRTAQDSDPAPAPTLDNQLGTALTAARAALADTRRLVADLTPGELSEQSLSEALQRVLTDRPAGRVPLHVEGEPQPLPTPAAVALLRGAQEAVANVEAHAAANRVQATLTFLPDAASLDVVDDGAGFDPDVPLGPSTGTGMGLPGLRTRAAEVDGTVEIDSAPGSGTAVNITVPYGQPRIAAHQGVDNG